MFNYFARIVSCHDNIAEHMQRVEILQFFPFQYPGVKKVVADNCYIRMAHWLNYMRID